MIHHFVRWFNNYKAALDSNQEFLRTCGTRDARQSDSGVTCRLLNSNKLNLIKHALIENIEKHVIIMLIITNVINLQSRVYTMYIYQHNTADIAMFLLLHWIMVVVGVIGTVCNILWITVYIIAYYIHYKLPFYPWQIDVLLVIQSIFDFLPCIILAAFNFWMISNSSNLNNSTLSQAQIDIIFGINTGISYIGFDASFGILAVIARIINNFLFSSPSSSSSQNINKKINQLSTIIIPTAIVLIISFALGFVAIFSNQNRLYTSRVYAMTKFENYDNIYVQFLFIVTTLYQTISVIVAVYYYTKLVKYGNKCSNMQQLNAHVHVQQNTTSCIRIFRKITKKQSLHRLTVSGIMMTSVLFVATLPVFIATAWAFVIHTYDLPILPDFLITLCLYSYSAFLNGFVVCNCSATYQTILKNIIHCRKIQINKKNTNNTSTFATQANDNHHASQIQISTAIVFKPQTVDAKNYNEPKSNFIRVSSHSEP